MYKRSVTDLLEEALAISPAVFVAGARQVGKSTLCLGLEREYRVFDSLTERAAATHDPVGYIDALPKPVTLDEIQKVPELLEGIKQLIDQRRINGQFLLTGSANVLDMKQARDTLAGRIIEIPLWPLSQKELRHKPDENLVDLVFQKGIRQLPLADVSYDEVLNGVVEGGYPEIQKIPSDRGRSLWFNAYISTYVERDIRDVGELRDISAFIRFYNIIAPRSGGLINKAELATAANLAEATVSNYLSMLSMIYQIMLLPPYSANIAKRFIKAAKMYLTDSGLFCHLLDIRDTASLKISPHKGHVVETFVHSELLKHIAYSETQPQFYHYRTNDKKEIDFIIEKNDRVFALEVKASQTIKADAFKHIIDFQKRSSKTVVGMVLYGGEHLLSFSEGEYERYAVPLGVFF